ncbi:MAG TPA: AlpA family phage regulatory protein [Terracidiphilus sp.]
MADKKNKTIETPGLPMVLRKKQVLLMVGLSASTVYSLQKAGSFPQPIKLSQRTTGWLTSDIQQWLQMKAAERAA